MNRRKLLIDIILQNGLGFPAVEARSHSLIIDISSLFNTTYVTIGVPWEMPPQRGFVIIS
jgi:hypothetical protein